MRRLSINAARSTFQTLRDGLGTLLLGLLAVSAVLIGLLAMHAMNLDPEHSVASTAAMNPMATDDSAVMPLVADIRYVTACDDSCGPEDAMPVIACLLAVLVISLIWGTRRITYQSGDQRTRFAVIAERIAGLPLPSPPSLHLLSISRT